MKTLRCLAVLGSLWASVAGAETPPAKPQAAPQGAPQGAPPMPRPAEEMKTLQFLTGKWKCAGTLTMAGAPGPTDVTATYTLKSDLNGFWLAGRMESPATRQNPMSHVEQDYWSFNPKTGGFQRTAFDSFGDTSHATATAWAGDTLQFTGNSTAFGNEVPYALGFTHQGDKGLLKINGTIGPADQPMVKVEYTCKK